MSYASEFLIEGTTLKEYYGAGGEIEIPDGVYDVVPFAFCYCEMDRVIIPRSMIRIKKEMFRRCKSLGTVVITGHEVRFGKNVFEYAPGMPIVEAVGVSLGDIPPEVKPNCCMGFAHALEEGQEIKKEIREQYLKYIKSQRKGLFDAAACDDPLLRLMVSEKVLSRDESQLMIQKLSERGKTEMASKVMEYQSENFKPIDPIKEMLREATRDPYSKKEMKELWKFEKKDDGTVTVYAYRGNEKDISVPERIGKNTVTRIAPRCFNGSNRERPPKGVQMMPIVTVTLPDTVSEIGREAFCGCDEMTAVNIPDGISEIPASAFADCRSLQKAAIPENVSEIGMRAFLRCRSLEEMVIPDRVTRIGQYAFSECENLSGLRIGKGVKIIETEAFSDCHSLTKVRIPSGTESLGYGAFGECESLRDVWIPKSVTEIGRDAFFGCPELTVHAPEGSFAQEYAEKHRLRFVSSR